MKVLGIIIMILLIISALAAVFVYVNKDTIFDYSVNRLVESLLPEYLEVDSLDVDLDKKMITVKGFKVLGPEGFQREYLIEIPEVRAGYSQKDQDDILKGFKLEDIDLINPKVYFERAKDGRINIQYMEEVVKSVPKKKEDLSLKSKLLAFISYIFSPIKRFEDLVEIRPVFNLKNGHLLFEDYYVSETGHKTTIERIHGDIELDLKEGFKGIDYVKTKGRGSLNGQYGQGVSWISEYDPKTPEVTMSNKFNIMNADFTHFKPYYDRFSPFVFKAGRASGDIIFNLDNGNIGSINEVRLSRLDIKTKEDQAYRSFWDMGVEDLHRYFTSSSGEVVFDFKVKGNLDRPKFYLGSKVKRALAGMLVGKISDAIFKKEEPASQQPTEEDQEKSDLEKIIDIFKGFRSQDEPVE